MFEKWIKDGDNDRMIYEGKFALVSKQMYSSNDDNAKKRFIEETAGKWKVFRTVGVTC